MSYTKNELAVIDLISDINKLFSYVGEENDQIDFDDLKQFEKYCVKFVNAIDCLLYTSPSPRDTDLSRMPSSA